MQYKAITGLQTKSKGYNSRKGWLTEKKIELDLKLIVALYVYMYIPTFVDIP